MDIYELCDRYGTDKIIKRQTGFTFEDRIVLTMRSGIVKDATDLAHKLPWLFKEDVLENLFATDWNIIE